MHSKQSMHRKLGLFERRYTLKAQIKKKQYVGFFFFLFITTIIVTISCFRTFLIFSQSYIFSFCMLFSLLDSLLFFFYRLCIGSRGGALVPLRHCCTPLCDDLE